MPKHTLRGWIVRLAIIIGALVALASLIVFSLWSLSGFGPAVSKADKQMADWKVNGLPTSQEELFLEPAPAPEENAAADIRAAMAGFKALGRPRFEEKHAEAASFHNGEVDALLKKNEPLMAELAQAVKKPKLRFERDWDQGAAVLLPEFADMKHFAKCFALRAQRRAMKGDGQGAASDIRTARRLGALASQDGSLIAGLVGAAIDAIALDAAGICAAELAEDKAALGALRQAVEDSKWDTNYLQMMRMEAYISLATLRNLSDRHVLALSLRETESAWANQGGAAKALVRQGMPRAMLAKGAVAESMEYWNKFYPRLLDPTEDFKKLGQEMETETRLMDDAQSLAKRAAATFLPVYAQAQQAFDRRRAEEKTAIAYITVLQYRQRLGRWPATLQEAGADGVDDIDGKPLRYQVSGSSARVWNVGQNGVDDGGLSRWEAKAAGATSRQTDGAYVYPWPPRPK